MKDGLAGVGVIGCGSISRTYLEQMPKFGNLKAVACADIDPGPANEKAEKYGIPALSVDDVLGHEEIDVILNLTIPAAHAEVALQALENGKHVYNEKPLGIARDEGRAVLQAAAADGLRVGCAPDTFLGAGQQTCRALIEEGAVGKPVAATACVMGAGMERWHPRPEFFFQPGGGPVFDMGPYYITALVNMLGPVRRVAGFTTKGFADREIGSGPDAGTRFAVNIDTTVMGVLEFASGPVATFIGSFDIKGGHHVPLLEVHGTQGSISCPDPNGFGGPVGLRRAGDEDWIDAKLVDGYTDQSRGIGLSDMMAAIGENRPHRAGGEVAFHVLDVMQAFYDASDTGRAVELESDCAKPAVWE
jgi:predicted dehydrogenase